MDQRAKCKSKQIYKTLRRIHRGNLHNLEVGKAFFVITPKAHVTKLKKNRFHQKQNLWLSVKIEV